MVQITELAKVNDKLSDAHIRRALLLDTPWPTSRMPSRVAGAAASDPGLGDAAASRAPSGGAPRSGSKTKRRRPLPNTPAAPRPPKRAVGRVVRANESAIVARLRDLLARTPVLMTIAERAAAMRAAASELDALEK